MHVLPPRLTGHRTVCRTGGYRRLWWLLGVLLMALPCAAADRTLVPLPIFTTDPNERQTYGALLAIINAEAGAFRSLLVPYATYNPLLGVAGSVHYERFFADRAKFDTDVSQSTQNQAFSALLYFFRHVLNRELGDLGRTVRARRRRRATAVHLK